MKLNMAKKREANKDISAKSKGEKYDVKTLYKCNT